VQPGITPGNGEMMIALLVLMACDAAPQPQTYPDKVAGVPMAGAAEGLIEVPVGTPMGGFSSRCKILGSSSKQDKRKSQYALAFDRSTGIVTPPMAKVLWLDTEDDHLVLVKFDAIYAYDGLVQRLEQELGKSSSAMCRTSRLWPFRPMTPESRPPWA